MNFYTVGQIKDLFYLPVLPGLSSERRRELQTEPIELFYVFFLCWKLDISPGWGRCWFFVIWSVIKTVPASDENVWDEGERVEEEEEAQREGTRRRWQWEFCGEVSFLKALSCYCNGRLRNASTHCSDQGAWDLQRRVGTGGVEKVIGKPERDQRNHIMSSGLYDLLIVKSYWRKTLCFQLESRKVFDFKV